MAAGPPGARCRTENPTSDTRQSTTTAWITRRAKYVSQAFHPHSCMFQLLVSVLLLGL